MEKAVKTFRTITQVPSISSAKILCSGPKNDKITVLSCWSQRCLERSKIVKFQQTYLVDTVNESVNSFCPCDSSTEVLSKFSPSEESRAVIREIALQGNGNGKKMVHLEIWNKSSLSIVRDLMALDVHENVYADSEFGCFEWSPCEKKLLYVAEKKIPKSEPFYKQKSQESNSKNDSGCGDNKVKGEEYVYREMWGEQLVDKHQPVFAVYNLLDDKITIVEGIPDDASPGQGCWAPDGGIVGVAWYNAPKRLGLIYCTNRESCIFHLSSDGKYRVLSDEGYAVRAPRFSPDGKTLVWIERPESGPHHDAHRLVKYCWSTGKIDIVIDIVQDKLDGVDPLNFRGLYNQSLPKRCWLSDNVHIIFSTPGPSSVTAWIVNIENKQLTLLKSNVKEDCSVTVLDVVNDTVLCSWSNLRHPSALVIGKFSSPDFKDIKWIPVTDYNCFPGLEHVKSGVYYTKATSHTSSGITDINALYIKPASDPAKKVPVIVYPHGGPHANFVDSFSPTVALFVLLGYGVIMVNYRGSTGFGAKYVKFLLGKVGDSDVKDVHQVAEELCDSTLTNFDSSRKVLFGGSHGGFLVAHLSGQYPDSYKVVSALNPVTDVSSMIGLTDIPDWCSVESGEPYSSSGDISKEDFNKMYDASPIRYASHVTAPTLLLIGKVDLRVPPSQGIQYYHKLIANDIIAKLLLYDDNHPLSHVPVELDSIINTVLWFNEHLNIKE